MKLTKENLEKVPDGRYSLLANGDRCGTINKCCGFIIYEGKATKLSEYRLDWLYETVNYEIFRIHSLRHQMEDGENELSLERNLVKRIEALEKTKSMNGVSVQKMHIVLDQIKAEVSKLRKDVDKLMKSKQDEAFKDAIHGVFKPEKTEEIKAKFGEPETKPKYNRDNIVGLTVRYSTGAIYTVEEIYLSKPLGIDMIQYSPPGTQSLNGLLNMLNDGRMTVIGKEEKRESKEEVIEKIKKELVRHSTVYSHNLITETTRHCIRDNNYGILADSIYRTLFP